MPSLVLGKVTKFQHHGFSRFGGILEKPEGWTKTPPATHRVNNAPFADFFSDSNEDVDFVSVPTVTEHDGTAGHKLLSHWNL